MQLGNQTKKKRMVMTNLYISLFFISVINDFAIIFMINKRITLALIFWKTTSFWYWANEISVYGR